MIYNLRNELEKMIDIYADHRKGMDKVVEEINSIKAKNAERAERLGLDHVQKAKLEAETAEKVKALEDDIKALKDSFITEASEQVAHIENIFGRKYRVDAEMLDDNVLKLINADVYTNDELVNLFKQYNENNNLAMMRVVAKAASKRAENISDADKKLKLKNLSFSVKSFNPKFAELTANTLEVCKRSLGIRENTLGEPAVYRSHEFAMRWAKRHSEMTEGYLRAAESITEQI